MMPGDPIVGGVALRRPAIQSPNFVTGVSGWTINADGTAEFNNGTFRGTVTAATIISALIESAASGRRTTIDANGDIKVYNASGAVLLWFKNSLDGMFFYADTGSASQGALVVSIANAAGTDPFGTSYVQGVVEYVKGSDGNTYALQLGTASSSVALFLNNITTPPLIPPALSLIQASPSGCGVEITSGKSVVASVSSGVIVEDSTISTIANGLVSLIAGQVSLGATGSMLWNDTTGQLSFVNPGSGPFIQSEGFHNLSNPGGITGTARVKLLPWNAIWYEGQVTNAGAIAATFTFGAPPNATYNPTTNLHRPVATNGGAVEGRLFIPTSGGPQLIVPAVPANSQWGWSLMIPTN